MTGTIYFLSFKNVTPPVLKIGWTLELDRRLSAIRRGNASDFEIIGTCPGDEANERALLKELAQYRSHYEFFFDVPEVHEAWAEFAVSVFQ
jgi:hypothetical protein